MSARRWLYPLTVIVGVILGIMIPAFAGGGGGPAGGARGGAGAAGGARGGRGGGGAIGTLVSATYKGLTTDRSYQPMPTTSTGPATQGGPTIITTTHAAVHVEPLSDEMRRTYGDRRGPISPFYTKMLNIRGVLVVGSPRVSDWAFLEAAYTLDHQFMNSPKWVTDGFAATKVHLAIIADVEYTMDLPENANMGNGAYNDRRSRGLGGFPWCSCAEENLLNLRGDPYGGNNPQTGGENITIHEFTHTTGSMIRSIQRTAAGMAGGGRGAPEPAGSWGARMDACYAKAMAPGGRLNIYNQQNNTKVYASNDWQEYWAEGAQAWFNNARPTNSGGISVREDVKEKDPDLAALLKEIYGDGEWRYIKTGAKKPDGTPMRPPEEFAHLVGFDDLRTQFPVFNYNNSPRIIADAIAATQGGATQTAPGGGRGGRRGGAATATASAPTTAVAPPGQ